MVQLARERVPAAPVRALARAAQVQAARVLVRVGQVEVPVREPVPVLAQVGEWAQERASVRVLGLAGAQAQAQVASAQAQAPERLGAVALARAGAVQALAAPVSVVPVSEVPAWVVPASLSLVSAARAWVVVQAAGVARSVAP